MDTQQAPDGLPLAPLLRRRLLATLVALGAFGSHGCAPSSPPAPEMLRVAYPSAPVSLDPHHHNNNETFSVLANIYDGLTAFDSEMRLRPALAESWYNPDDISWRLVLRQGVRFHDGRALGIADVVASLERARLHPSSVVKSYLSAVEAVTAIDDRTLEIRTGKPYPLLAHKLTFISIVPRDAPETIVQPVGTGPFRFESQEEGHLVLSSAPEAWAGAPPWKAMRFEFESSSIQRAESFRAGEVDLAVLLEGIGEVLDDREQQLVRHDGNSVTYLGFRVDQPPFSDVRVRRGLDLAIDRVAAAARLNGEVAPIGQLVGQQINGYVPGLTPRLPAPALARELLAAGGLPPESRLTLDVAESKVVGGRIFADQLAAFGLEVEVVGRPTGEHFARVVAGESSFFMLSYLCSTGDASDLFDAALHTADSDRGLGMANLMRYSNPDLDSLVEQAAETLDMTARRQLLARTMEIALDDLPVIPLWQRRLSNAVRPGLVWEPRMDYRVLGATIRPSG